MKSKNLYGTGLGFRMENADEILAKMPSIPWFEILIDNFMTESASLSIVDMLVEHYPISFHGVGLNIGSTAELNRDYLAKLKKLSARWEPHQISDHFAWTATPEYRFHELMPLPFIEDAIQNLETKITQVQEFLGRQILLENSSSYVTPPSEMTEWEFINEICARSGCGLLLDVNNIHVNAFNQKFLVSEYLSGIDVSNVGEIHLAGYEDKGDHYFDSHSQPVADKVWTSFEKIIESIPATPTLLEWDNDIPSLDNLISEIEKAEHIRHSLLARTEKCSAM